MILYLEAIEVVESEEQTPDFIRLKVEGSEADTLKDLKALLNPDKKYEIRRHYCMHDEEKPCRVEVIE